MKQLKEELLHFIWKSKFLFNKELVLTNLEKVTIVHPGTLNIHAGPDFTNAHIKIGNNSWYGNIEIHIRSSDWILHKHQLDARYNNVILHVVYHHDKRINYANGSEIPTLEVYKFLPPLLLKKYRFLQKSESVIPCEPIFKLPKDVILKNWLDRLFVDRLERKTADFLDLLKANANNWEEAFYYYTARYVGGKINAMPFEWLAQKLPLQIIARHRNNLFQLRALCFGLAGFPHHHLIKDYDSLKNEFDYLKLKYQLEPIEASVWKFSRMHPGGFPTKRIEQFAILLYESTHLFSKIQGTTTLEELKSLYRIEHLGKRIFTENMIDLLLINSVLPLLFLYGNQMHHDKWRLLSIQFYEEIFAEDNKIIRYWARLGIKVENAFDSQALIELKTNYCDTIKCLHCAIGHNLLLNE